MWEYTHYDELYHYGVLGMKWGVRRYRKKDGSLTSAGKKRYNDAEPTKKKSKHRLMLEEKFKKGGLSQEQAEAEASKRIRTEIALGTVATVTVAACAAYVVNKKLKERIDRVIKSGTGLQRIEMQDTGGKLHDTFYTSKGKHDNERYANLLGATRQKQTGEAYRMKLETTKDIKVASKDNATKIFERLYKNDPDFRSSVKSHVSSHFNGSNRLNPNDTSAKNMKKMYENFNANLIDIRNKGSGADKKFYSAMRDAGYGAIQDINDMKYSGYKAKNPLIIFGNSQNVVVKSVEKMGDMKLRGTKELRKAFGESAMEELLKQCGPMVAAGTSLATVTTIAEDHVAKSMKPTNTQNTSTNNNRR